MYKYYLDGRKPELVLRNLKARNAAKMCECENKKCSDFIIKAKVTSKPLYI